MHVYSFAKFQEEEDPTALEYEPVTDQWKQNAPNKYGEAPGDQFGFDVSISGDGLKMAVSAPFNRGDGFERGRVYVYDVSE